MFLIWVLRNIGSEALNSISLLPIKVGVFCDIAESVNENVKERKKEDHFIIIFDEFAAFWGGGEVKKTAQDGVLKITRITLPSVAAKETSGEDGCKKVGSKKVGSKKVGCKMVEYKKVENLYYNSVERSSINDIM